MWGADRFVAGAAAVARNLGVSELIVGLTIVGLGTSAPEMLVSAVAAWTGSSGISIGNAIGSNVTNIALVLGVAAIVRPLRVHSKIVHREIPLLLAVMVLAFTLMLDGTLSRLDGLVLLGGMVALVTWTVRQAIHQAQQGYDPLSTELTEEMPKPMSTPRGLFWFAVGLVTLLASSRGLVWGAVSFARMFGVAELVIGVTVIAFGTSLPELAASVAAAFRNEHDIAVGNVVGSNMFNVLGVLGLAGVVGPGPFDSEVLSRDFPAMAVLTVGFLLLARAFGTRMQLARWQGVVMVAGFVGYLLLLARNPGG